MSFEIEELISDIYSITDEQRDEEDFDFDVLLEEKLETDVATFHRVASILLPYAHIWSSPLTKSTYKGFVNHDKGFAIYKKEIKPCQT